MMHGQRNIKLCCTYLLMTKVWK